MADVNINGLEITFDLERITITEYPQGDMSYNFVWNDRKTYVYSR